MPRANDPPLLTRRRALAMLAAPLALPLVGCREMFAPEAAPASLATAGALSQILIGAGDPHAGLNNANAMSVGRLIQRLLDQHPGARAFALGDLAKVGTAEEMQAYHAAWGAFKAQTDFQIGNHDFIADPTAAPYYDYVGSDAGARGKGYYARTYGAWRGYYLNSMRNISEQAAWLAADLPRWAAGYHIYAMWHHPMFASVCEHHGRSMAFPTKLGAWWQLLQDHGAEFVISGHVHRYERFPRMPRNGLPSAAGMRQFITGTGGAKPMPILSVHPQSERQLVMRGALTLSLFADRYEWTFADLTGTVRDSGAQVCR
jgi:hypothetical protein